VVVQPRATDGLPRERYTVPILEEVGQSKGMVWTSAENLAPLWVRNTTLPALREFLIADCAIPAHLKFLTQKMRMK